MLADDSAAVASIVWPPPARWKKSGLVCTIASNCQINSCVSESSRVSTSIHPAPIRIRHHVDFDALEPETVLERTDRQTGHRQTQVGNGLQRISRVCRCLHELAGTSVCV